MGKDFVIFVLVRFALIVTVNEDVAFTDGLNTMFITFDCEKLSVTLFTILPLDSKERFQ